MNILGIETSCDETSAAVVKDGCQILSNVISSQIKFHQKFGGVVPEIASRKHLENICWVIEDALRKANVGLNKIDAIGVTAGPGLIGALLVGLSIAKSLAYAQRIPLIACHHLEGHMHAITAQGIKAPYPAAALIVSGGHTSLYLLKRQAKYELLGQTRDDAAGEAFDKVAKMLHLGYQGGPVIDELAASGNPKAILFPRSYLEKGSLDFSFSGLKTAVWYYIKKQNIDFDKDFKHIKDIAASFQQAVVDVLVNKAIMAAKANKVTNILMAGGVACNSQLREQMQQTAQKEHIKLYYPDPILCTDNAAMIASCAYYAYLRGDRAYWSQNAYSNRPLEE